MSASTPDEARPVRHQPPWRARLPNALSLARLLFSPLLGVPLPLADRQAFAVLSAVLLLTDGLDGYLARRWQVTSDLGNRLDTYADWVFFPCFGLGSLYLLRGFFGQYLASTILLAVLLLGPPLLGPLRWRRIVPLHLTSARLLGGVFGLFLLTALWFEPNVPFFLVLVTLAAVRAVEETLVVYQLQRPEDDEVRSLAELLRRQRARRHRATESGAAERVS